MDIASNGIDSHDASTVTQLFKNTLVLQELNLALNDIDSDGVSAVAQSFQYTQALQHLMLLSIIQAEIPFTNDMGKLIAFVNWEESITHKAEQTSHSSALAIVTKEMLLQSWASA